MDTNSDFYIDDLVYWGYTRNTKVEAIPIKYYLNDCEKLCIHFKNNTGLPPIINITIDFINVDYKGRFPMSNLNCIKTNIRSVLHYKFKETYSGLIKPMMVNSDFIFPITEFTPGIAMFYINSFILNFKEPWFFECESVTHGKNIINSLYDLQSLLSIFPSSIKNEKMSIKNPTNKTWKFNKTFQIYCDLTQLKPNEETTIQLQSKSIKIQLNKQDLFLIDSSCNCKPEEKELSYPLKLSFINNRLGDLIQKNNIEDTSVISINFSLESDSPKNIIISLL